MVRVPGRHSEGSSRRSKFPRCLKDHIAIAKGLIKRDYIRKLVPKDYNILKQISKEIKTGSKQFTTGAVYINNSFLTVNSGTKKIITATIPI